MRRRALAVLLSATVLGAACSGDDGTAEDAVRPEEEAAAAASPDDPLEITTDLGVVRGAVSAVEEVRAFLSIPYAAPPVGDDRWRPPQPREPYDGLLDATAPGPSCPQDMDAGLAAITPIPDPDEDCLSLNVWSPIEASDLPVMVWFPGGGLRSGSAHQPLYVGDDLAAEGVVVVGVNYRVGALGFLATDELAEESDDGTYGNYGLADQVAALEWVQRNVAAFGGDPDNVTIFGESAGGFSVCGHLASPASADLFERAIIQSGGGCDRLQDADDARAAGAALLDAIGCADIACLRALPTDDVVAAPFDPSLVADGERLSETAQDLGARGELADVEVLIGSNADEEALFTLGMDEPTDAELPGLFAELSDDPDALLALYPPEGYDSNLARYRAMRTDVRFACPTLAFAEARTAGDTYVYEFTWVSPDDPFGLGAPHGAELVPLFGHPEGIAGLEPGLQGDDAAMSADMQAAWAAFAATGEPSVSDDSVWRPYGDDGQVTLLDQPLELVTEIRDGRCDAVEELTELRR